MQASRRSRVKSQLRRGPGGDLGVVSVRLQKPCRRAAITPARSGRRGRTRRTGRIVTAKRTVSRDVVDGTNGFSVCAPPHDEPYQTLRSKPPATSGVRRWDRALPTRPSLVSARTRLAAETAPLASSVRGVSSGRGDQHHAAPGRIRIPDPPDS